MSSSSSTSQSQVTQDEFFAFHNIDRQLFYRLVFILRHDPSLVMQVIAFWIWLERIFKCVCVNTILTFPDTVIEAVFEETVIVLRAAESDEYHRISNDAYDTPILQSIIGKEQVNIRYFHENRIALLRGVGNIVQEVCLRAFQDFIRFLSENKIANHPRGNVIANVASDKPRHTNTSFKVGDFNVPLENPSYFITSLKGGLNNTNDASSSNNFNIFNNRVPNMIEEDLMCLFSKLGIGENQQSLEVGIIPPGERTIFLTFSKGYHISEPELRDFLYGSFGDIIDTLYMQEVIEDEQPLFARLVVRDIRAMEVVLNGQPKVKFAINGKHVWARKFVRKNPNSPPSSPSGAPNSKETNF